MIDESMIDECAATPEVAGDGTALVGRAAEGGAR